VTTKISSEIPRGIRGGEGSSMVVFSRRSGTERQLSKTLLAQTAAGGAVDNLFVWMADKLRADLTVSKLACRVAMSPRN
jgi:transcriptional regulator GlxA family with amidase domain